jgi:hypothetical protein
MTTEALDTERELAQPPAQGLAGPLLFSVVLHGLVMLVFMRAVFAPQGDTPAVEEPGIRVTLATRMPTQEREVPVPEVTEAPAPTRDESGEIVDAVVEVEPTPAASAEVAVTPAVAGAPTASGETTEPRSADSSPGDSAWTPARIRAAVQATSGELRSNFTNDWMEDCIRERRARGLRDCERQREEQDLLSANAAAGRSAGIGAFTSVTRADQHWRIAEGFKKSNDTLRELVDAGGLVGELATARYYLNREILVYLNGNQGDMVFGPMQNFAADVLGGTALTVNGNTSFQCKAKKKVEYDADLKTRRVSGGNNVPCVYEYTGFTIKRPEPEADPNAFRVVPPVFGSQR